MPNPLQRVLLAAALALSSLAALTASASARPQADGLLVIASARDGDSELYLLRESGQVVARLTRNRFADGSPRFSPDGRRIAFVSNRDGDDELFVMNADGTGVRRLTSNRVRDETPAWSPDGRRLAFVRERAGDLLELWTMRADGSGARRIVRASRAVNEQAYSPAWSPDGRRIVFSSNRPGEGNPELYSVGPDGGGLVRLTRTAGDPHTLGDDGMPAFSPDGRTIAFSSNRLGGNGELWTMRPDGSAQRRLVARPRTDDWSPRFSPDGTRIAFVARSATDPSASGRVVVVGAGGGGARTLGAGDEVDWQPAPPR